MRDLDIWVCVVCVRILSVYLVRTSFVPDEYWQSLEVAHYHVFDTGHLTWEFKEGIRSPFHISIFIAVLKLVKALGLESTACVYLMPRVLQALVTATADICLFRYVNQTFSRHIAKWALFCNICNWFWFYCGSRTLVNTFEGTSFVILLSLYRERTFSSSSLGAAVGLSFLFALRPTSLFLWVVPWLLTVVREKSRQLATWSIVFLAVQLISILMDSLFYRRATSSMVNFLTWNLVHNIGEFYGVHSWHWYWTQGLPVVLLTQLPLAFSVVFDRSVRHILCIVIPFIVVHSFIPHKEFRFLLPVVPLLSILCGVAFSKLSHQKKLAMAVIILLFHLPVGYYTSMIHQRAPLQVMDFVRKQAVQDRDAVLLLLPCHTTPYYSHVHANVSMRFLECNPPGTQQSAFEQTVFYSDPIRWLSQSDFVPSIVVTSDRTAAVIADWIQNRSFKQCASYFMTHFPEGEMGNNLVILARSCDVDAE